MNLSKVLLTLGSVTAIAGGAGAYVYFNGVPGGPSGAIGRADAVPDEALGVAYISTDLNSWKQIQKFGTPEAQAALEKGLGVVNQSLKDDSNLSFEEDIAPWIDGVMVAALPAAEKAPDQDPEALMVVGIKNPARALALLGKVKQDKTAKLSEETYKDVKITKIEQKSQTTFAAVLGTSQLIISDNLDAIHRSINTQKGEPSLADQPATKTALSNPLKVENAVIQAFIPSYGKLVTPLLAQAASSNPAASKNAGSKEALAMLDKLGAVTTTLGIEDQGLRLKGSAQVDPSLRPEGFKPNPNSALQRFPANTIAFSSLNNFSASWDRSVQQLGAMPDGQTMLSMMRSVTQTAGLDLDKEIFGWMKGEIAFGLLPQKEGMMGSMGVGAVLLADSGDRPSTEGFLKKIDKLASQNSLKVSQQKQGSGSVTEWQSPMLPGETIVGHGWVDQDSMFMAISKPLVNQMTQTPQQPLGKSPAFQAAIAGLPSQNLGYTYVNIQEALKLMEPHLQPVVASQDPEAQSAKEMLAVAQSVESIAAASTWDKPEQTMFDMRINLTRK